MRSSLVPLGALHFLMNILIVNHLELAHSFNPSLTSLILWETARPSERESKSSSPSSRPFPRYFLGQMPIPRGKDPIGIQRVLEHFPESHHRAVVPVVDSSHLVLQKQMGSILAEAFCLVVFDHLSHAPVGVGLGDWRRGLPGCRPC